MNMRLIQTAAALMTAVVLVACGSDTSTSGGSKSDTAHHLSILAGSEVKDLEPLLPEIQNATGVTLDMTYSGTLSGIDAIESGTQTPDAAWFAQDHYFGLTDTKHVIKKSTPTMISPVILGVKESKAQELGWLGHRIGWKDVEAAIAAGKFHYAMTSPTTSNSGFAAIIGITSAFSNAGDAVSTKDVNKTKLTEFFSGQKLMSGSSGWLADAYQNSEADLDGMINYESIILALDDAKSLHEQLVPIYPKEGTVIANYPLVLLNDTTSDDYAKVVQFIRTPAFQKKLMANTHRRPILPQIALAPEFDKNLLIDTPFPASRSTVDAMLGDYLNKHRLAAHTFYVLDKTGSMDSTDGTDQTRIQRVQEALNVLTGGDNSITGRFARFDDRERITIITFSEHVEQDRTFEMKQANDAKVFGAVKDLSNSLEAGGDTAIYDALERALDEAEQDTSGRYKSIVLMTDGENNHGETADEFVNSYRQRKQRIRIFPIFIGEARPAELEQIATVSGGHAFDARKEALADVFKDIRGYQ
jgi:Ca-activated chloride channel family protein